MNSQKAKSFSQNLLLKATSYALIILSVILLFSETKGDFANGILFFLSNIFNIYSIVGVTLLFLSTALFARQAGNEIISKNKAYLPIAIKYAFFISSIFTVYVLILVLTNILVTEYGEANPSIQFFVLPLFLKTLIIVVLIWVWATQKSIE